MPLKVRTPIIISSHAMKRWRERVGNEKATQIQNAVRTAIKAATRKGMKVKNGTSTVWITKEVSAVVSPSLQGGWEVITVIREERVG